MNHSPGLWRAALRRLGRDRIVTVVVLASLGLGLGAATSLFGLVDSLFLRPPAGISEPEGLISLTPRPIEIPGLPGTSFHVPLSYPTYRAYADRTDLLSGLAAFQPIEVHMATGDHVERIDSEIVSSDYFEVLRVRAEAGRLFTPDLNAPEGQPDELALAHSLWRSWGSPPDVVGRTVRLNGAPFTIVGITPEGFHGTRRTASPQLWVTIAAASRVLPGMTGTQVHDPEHGWLFWFVGRLRPEVALPVVQARLDGVAETLGEQGADDEQAAGLVARAGIGLRPDEESTANETLSVLLIVVAFLFWIACLNTAILLLSRVPRRSRDASIKLALGAARRSLFVESLAESFLLSVGAALVGLLLTWVLTGFVVGLDFAGFLPDVTEGISIDLRTLGFTLAIATFAALVFGLAPALRASRVDPAPALKGGAGGDPRGERLARLMVIAQVAVCVVLVACTGLLLRSFLNHQRVPLGFETDTVLNARMDLERQGYGEEEGRAFFARVVEEVSAVPGVEEVSLASSVPLTRGGNRNMAQIAPGTGPLAGEAEAWVTYDAVGPSYLRTVGIPLLDGRDFREDDSPSSPPVVLINRALAETFWPDEDAVGQWLTVGSEEARVVGIAANARIHGLTAPPEPHFYRPIYQQYQPVATLHVRSNVDAASLLAPVESRIRRLDPRLPLFDRGLMAAQLDQALVRPRFALLFVGLTALLGLLLAIVGVGGVIYRRAVMRHREIAIRLSLGARRSDVLWMFWRQGLTTGMLGLLLGVLGALALSRTLASFLYGVSAHDPVVYAVVMGVVAAVILLANGLPAYLGTRLDPATVLREE